VHGLTQSYEQGFSFKVDHLQRTSRPVSQLVCSSKLRAVTGFCLFYFGSVLLVWECVQGDEIVLRNLEKLTEINVASMDEDGIRLSDGRLFSLDSILSANVAEQEGFDRLHTRFSEPLFRVKVRLRKQDFENIGEQLLVLQPVYASRSGRSAALVNFAQLRFSVENGDPILAIYSYFQMQRLADSDPMLLEFFQSIGDSVGSLEGYSKHIRPFELNRKSIIENWDSIVTAYLGLPVEHPSGLDFYFFAIADARGLELRPDIAANRIKLNSREKSVLDHLKLAYDTAASSDQWQQALIRMTDDVGSSNESVALKALNLFAIGKIKLKNGPSTEDDGLLTLLGIHAEYGPDAPMVAAAALFEVFMALKDRDPGRDAKNIKKELLSRYPSSDFAKRLRMMK
jgi:hypothetical protein